MKIIGITGGIGTGKTTVSDYIRALGYKVFDADLVSAGLTDKGGEALPYIRESFGEEFFTAEGELNKKALAQEVFSDPQRRKILEGVVTDRVIDIMHRQIEEWNRAGEYTTFIDAPLLFECNLEGECDSVWVIACEDELRIERIIKRGGIDREDAIKRIQAQMPQAEKIAKADRVIYNNGGLAELMTEVQKSLEEEGIA